MDVVSYLNRHLAHALLECLMMFNVCVNMFESGWVVDQTKVCRFDVIEKGHAQHCVGRACHQRMQRKHSRDGVGGVNPLPKPG